jgi:acylphosphatase
MSADVRRRVAVHGHVQGVYFRESVRRLSAREGVRGWVANRRDGAVEAVLEGPPAAVEAVIALCRRGPRGAVVESVDVAEEPVEGVRGFAVR